MLAFRVPSYCCVVASSWGWGLFRLPSRVLFFPSRVPPSAFCCVAFRLSLCRVPPSAFCLLPSASCALLLSVLLPSAGVVVVPLPRAPRLCRVRLGGGSTGCCRAFFRPLFFFFSSPGRPKATRGARGKRRRPGPRPRLASPRQGLVPRLFFSSPGAAPRARVLFFFFASPLRRLVPRRHEGLDKACSVWYTSWCGRGTASPPDTKGNTP